VVCPTWEPRPTLLCKDERDAESQEFPHEQQGEEEEELIEDRLEGSNLPLCVIKSMLTGQKVEEPSRDEWLRTNIFHTRVEYNGKALNLIIDNRCGMNVISQEAVDKLKVSLERHPKPYKVSWVDDTSIPVKQRCLVSFSLGKNYKDSVWCDVIPMKACNILLDRPWLYDRRVHYDGYSNTYSFPFEGHRIVLQPVKIEEFKQTRPETSCVLTMLKFDDVCQDCGIVFMLVAKTILDETRVDSDAPFPTTLERVHRYFA
jgi:hypothetical protein